MADFRARLARLERLTKPAGPSWAEYQAAEQRLKEALEAKLHAFFGHPHAPLDPDQVARDRMIVRQWCVSKGIDPDAGTEDARRILQDCLTRLWEARHGTHEPPGAA